jgi:hypothetical protein
MERNTETLNTKDVRYVHAYVGDDVKTIDTENHRINFVVSSDIVDRSCEIVEAEAVYEAIHRKNEFTANPICLPCHMHRLNDGSPPVVGSWDTTTAKQRKHHVEMVLQFDTEYELGNKYWIVYKNRTMRAVSIGFRIQEYHEEMKDGKRTWIITKIELVEISCVAVGCNQKALAKLKELGLGDSSDQTKALNESIRNIIKEEMTAMTDTVTDYLDEIKDMLCVDPDGIAESMLDDDSDLAEDGDVNKDVEQTFKKLANTLTEHLKG